MSNVFFASDHHFGHNNILTFTNYDGSKARDFTDLNEMHDTMVYNHNSVVGKSDLIYFLGDVCIELTHLEQLGRMNGRKILVKGNHDIFHLPHYLKYFEDIVSYKVFPDEFICSHIPLHTESLSKRFLTNVHAHTHSNTVRVDGTLIDDPRYINVCMEKINFTPVEKTELLKRTKKSMEDYASYIDSRLCWELM